MTAIVIDLKDFGTRTPAQVVRVFFELYPPEEIEAALWSIFKVCAKVMEKESHEPEPGITATANLFDHLIAFTKAIHQLRAGTPGKCIICGRSPAGDSS